MMVTTLSLADANEGVGCEAAAGSRRLVHGAGKPGQEESEHEGATGGAGSLQECAAVDGC